MMITDEKVITLALEVVTLVVVLINRRRSKKNEEKLVEIDKKADTTAKKTEQVRVTTEHARETVEKKHEETISVLLREIRDMTRLNYHLLRQHAESQGKSVKEVVSKDAALFRSLLDKGVIDEEGKATEQEEDREDSNTGIRENSSKRPY